MADRILQAEYDPEYRIVHITAEHAIRIRTLEEGLKLAEEVKELLAGYLGGERGYLIVDYSKIQIETRYIQQYSQFIKDLYNRFLFPDGLARYGMSISRVMANLSHRKYVSRPANLFGTKRDAYDFIRKLVKAKQETVANG